MEYTVELEITKIGKEHDFQLMQTKQQRELILRINVTEWCENIKLEDMVSSNKLNVKLFMSIIELAVAI